MRLSDYYTILYFKLIADSKHGDDVLWAGQVSFNFSPQMRDL